MAQLWKDMPQSRSIVAEHSWALFHLAMDAAMQLPEEQLVPALHCVGDHAVAADKRTPRQITEQEINTKGIMILMCHGAERRRRAASRWRCSCRQTTATGNEQCAGRSAICCGSEACRT